MSSGNRRQFLKSTLAVAGGLVFANCESSEDEDAPASPFFPQSLASGDPRPDSVILWTRVVDAARPGQDLVVSLEVARDRGFGQRVVFGAAPELDVPAEARFDGCVKVRLTGLSPGTTYYYRFVYQVGTGRATTRVGRTRTAPDPGADVPVRFAVASCQSYGGNYFHSYRHMAEQELDFFVHLGDYIYETTSDVTAAPTGNERVVTIADAAGALPLPGGTAAGLAARSLANYRSLYQVYRGDPDLQRVHERFPMIAVGDDHEFSNDGHGAVGTYFDGRSNETDVERRANADQAWFEYMPIDFEVPPARAFDRTRVFPDQMTVYRDFGFGRHVHVVMTDLRRHRLDHLVPEDAFPGAMALAEADVLALVGAAGPPAFAVPYVDIDAFAAGAYRDGLRAAAAVHGFTAERIAGAISAVWINERLAALTAAGVTTTPALAPIDLTRADLPRGIAYHQLMKTEEFSSVGSRIFIRQPPFALLAAHLQRVGGGQREQILGEAQRRWFLDTMKASTRTWKVWGNQFGFMRRMIDLSNFALAPEALRDKFLLGAEDWDGMPNERDAVLAALAEIDNVVIVTGDMHAFLVGTPFAAGDPRRRVIEVIAGSLTSTPLQTVLSSAAASGALQSSGVSALALLLPALLTDPLTRPNPHLAFTELARNGYVTMQADGHWLEFTLHMIDPARVKQNPAALGPVKDAFTAARFRVQATTRELYREMAGAWQRWDVASYSWV